jgi:hypothetical protein
MSETTFEPTNQCFDDALDLLSYIVKKKWAEGKHLGEDWKLVHAICKAEGGEFAHAWCERDGKTVVTAFMIDGKHTYVEIGRRDYYRLFQPQEMTRYTVDEAMLANLRTNNFGPWEQRYREACGGGRILGAVTVKVR